jgi:hypothetical protein
MEDKQNTIKSKHNENLKLNTSINCRSLINNVLINNPPLDLIFDNIDTIDKFSTYKQRAMVVGTDHTKLSVICLRPGTIAEIKIFPQECKTDTDVLEVKFGSCFDPHRLEITEQYNFTPLLDDFEHTYTNNILSIGTFILQSNSYGLSIDYKNDNLFKDSYIYSTEEDGPKYSNSERFAFIAFKNCFLEINVIEYNDIRSKYHHKLQLSLQ